MKKFNEQKKEYFTKIKMAYKRGLLNPHPSSLSLLQNIQKEFSWQNWVQQKLWIELSIPSGLDNSRRSTLLSNQIEFNKSNTQFASSQARPGKPYDPPAGIFRFKIPTKKGS